MDFPSEQGYHGRRNTLTWAPTARVTGRSNVLSPPSAQRHPWKKLRQPSCCKIPTRTSKLRFSRGSATGGNRRASLPF